MSTENLKSCLLCDIKALEAVYLIEGIDKSVLSRTENLLDKLKKSVNAQDRCNCSSYLSNLKRVR